MLTVNQWRKLQFLSKNLDRLYNVKLWPTMRKACVETEFANKIVVVSIMAEVYTMQHSKKKQLFNSMEACQFRTHVLASEYNHCDLSSSETFM